MIPGSQNPKKSSLARIVFWLRVAVAVGLLTVLFRFVGLDRLAATLTQAHPGWAVVVVFGLVAWQMLGAFKVYLLLRTLTQAVSFPTFFRVYLTSWATSLLLPGQLGDATQVLLLHKYGVSVDESGAAYVFDKGVSLSWMVLVSALGLRLCTPLGDATILALLVAIAFAGIVAILVWRTVSRKGEPGRLLGSLQALARQMLSFRANAPLMLTNLSLTIVKWLVLGWVYLCAFRTFGSVVSFKAAATIPIMSSFVGYIPVTLGGAGTSEWTAVYLFGQIGLAAPTILSVFLLLRSTLLIGAAAAVALLR